MDRSSGRRVRNWAQSAGAGTVHRANGGSEVPAPAVISEAPMVVWHLADVSLNPSMNAFPGGGTLQNLSNGLGACAVGRRAGRTGHRRRSLGPGRARPELPADHGRSACRARLGTGRVADRRSVADHQFLLPHRDEPALIEASAVPAMLAAGCTGLDGLNPSARWGAWAAPGGVGLRVRAQRHQPVGVLPTWGAKIGSMARPGKTSERRYTPGSVTTAKTTGRVSTTRGGLPKAV